MGDTSPPPCPRSGHESSHLRHATIYSSEWLLVTLNRSWAATALLASVATVPINRNHIRLQAQEVRERGDDENWRHLPPPGRLEVQLVVALVEVVLELVAVEEAPPQQVQGVQAGSVACTPRLP